MNRSEIAYMFRQVSDMIKLGITRDIFRLLDGTLGPLYRSGDSLENIFSDDLDKNGQHDIM